MSRFPMILMIISLFGSVGYEHYRLLSLKNDMNTLRKENNQQQIIYNNEIKTLQNNIENQSNQINSMKNYISNSNTLSNNISNLKNEYSKTKHDSQSITTFENSLFDKFGE